MSDQQAVRRELEIAQPIERVWQALTTREALAEWMYPNDFEPRVGHRFSFNVPPKPEVGFDGLVVRCEVLACEAPWRLVFSWSGGEPVENTRVSFELEPQGRATRLTLEHTGFDLGHPFGRQALKGAEFGWSGMLGRLESVAAGLAAADGSGELHHEGIDPTRNRPLAPYRSGDPDYRLRLQPVRPDSQLRSDGAVRLHADPAPDRAVDVEGPSCPPPFRAGTDLTPDFPPRAG